MKKYFTLLCIFALLITAVSISYASDDITVRVNGEVLVTDQPAVIHDGRTLVPLRAICEKLNCDVAWNDATKTAIIKNEIITVAAEIDNYSLTKRFSNKDAAFDKSIILQVPPMVINGRTMVPARAISEAFNAKVNWDGETKTVDIDMQYQYIDDMTDGYYLAKVSNEQYAILDEDGNIVNTIRSTRPLEAPSKHSESIILYDRSKGVYGIKDIFNANDLVPIQYDRIEYIPGTKGVYKVKELSLEGKYSLWSKANPELDFKYDSVYFSANGYILIEDNDKFGLADENGSVVISPMYVDIIGKNGYFVASKDYTNYGLIDGNNNIVLDFEYRDFGGFTHNGCLLKKVDFDKEDLSIEYVHFDFDKKALTEKYDYDYMKESYGYFMVDKDGRRGILASDLTTVIVPVEYDNIKMIKRNATNVVFEVTQNNKKGVINKKGEVIIPAMYSELYFLYGDTDSAILANIDGRCGIINWRNEVLVPIIYDSCYHYMLSVDKGYFEFKKGDETVKVEVPFE